jgi:hypothetical protein
MRQPVDHNNTIHLNQPQSIQMTFQSSDLRAIALAFFLKLIRSMRHIYLTVWWGQQDSNLHAIGRRFSYHFDFHRQINHICSWSGLSLHHRVHHLDESLGAVCLVSTRSLYYYKASLGIGISYDEAFPEFTQFYSKSFLKGTQIT